MAIEDIDDAISDLSSRIARTGYREELISQVAEDWDVRAPLLVRKFVERNGTSPQDWTPPDPMSGIGITLDEIRQHSVAFSIEQRVVRTGPAEWRYVEGIVLEDRQRHLQVIQSVLHAAVMAIPIGQRRPKKLLINQAFGSYDEFLDKVRAADTSRIEPPDFADWCARRASDTV